MYENRCPAFRLMMRDTGSSSWARWAAKPRRGVGLSASALTNSYIKLGGTLSEPSLTIKPLQAVTATTAAVATAGLSILAKGFWDRFTSGKRSCRKAKKRVGFE